MDFFDFWWILKGFGEAKASQKLIFGKVFGDAFFEHVLASILGRLFKAQNLKNSNFPSISIVGATGAVGKICLDILNERDYPVEKINLFASSRSAGKKIIYGR